MVPLSWVALVMLASCGLPSEGPARRVDDGEVPYHLLQSASGGADVPQSEGQGARSPSVLWLHGERLVPEPSGGSCDDRPETLVKSLLGALSAGPSDEARAAGMSSAIPTDSGLDVIGLAGGTVEVDIELQSSVSAERLPVAVAQVVLTLTSAPTVRAVEFIANGAPAKVPLPDGALTEGPVAAQDYVELLPDRLRLLGAFGCHRS